MKHSQKNTKQTLEIKKVGRPAKVDKGIRHICRERIFRPTALHLTIKVRENKADIQNKRILKALHHAIKRARIQKLRILHYTLEYNHVHILVEASNNRILHKGMQAFGISIAKAINKLKRVKGAVYKHRYHFNKIESKREFKNVLIYIFRNGMKHKRAMSMLDPYNSFPAEKLISADMHKLIDESRVLSRLREELKEVLDERKVYFVSRNYLWEGLVA